MKAIIVARKSFTGTLVENTIKHGTGSINVDGCRISSGVSGAGGRWPANVFLVHHSGCKRSGTRTEKGYIINRWKDGAKPFGGGAGHPYESEKQPDSAVEVWECVNGCLAREMGRQSGFLTSGSLDQSSVKAQNRIYGQREYKDGIGFYSSPKTYGKNSGTAARYFKQFQEQDMNELPQEVFDYLQTLISPPPEYGPVILVGNPKDIRWDHLSDQSVHGGILTDDPGCFMEDVNRVLKQGSHLLIVAPDHEPTGHTAACRVEDNGFEIRDSILVLDEEEGFFYTAKASPRERHSGVTEKLWRVEEEIAYLIDGITDEEIEEVESIFTKSQANRLLSGKGIHASKVPEDGLHLVKLDTEVSERRIANSHPTTKPRAMMKAILKDIPTSHTILDPFIGSGTTAMACLETGHDCIGIDLDPEYLQIAEERVRFWDSADAPWDPAEIESEASKPERERSLVEDMFG